MFIKVKVKIDLGFGDAMGINKGKNRVSENKNKIRAVCLLLLCSLLFYTGLTYFVSGSLVKVRDPLFRTALISTLTMLYSWKNKKSLAFFVPYLCFLSVVLIFPASGEIVRARETAYAIECLTITYCLFLLICLLLPDGKGRKIFTGAALFLILLPAGMEWGYFAISHSMIHEDTILAVEQTNWKEALEYAETHFKISQFLLFVLLCFIVYYFSQKSPALPYLKTACRFHKKLKIALFTALMVFSGCSLGHTAKNPFLLPVVQAQASLQKYNDFAAQKAEREQHMRQLVLSQKGRPGIYVLVIGESENKLHMNAYGCPKNTMPWLSKEKNDPRCFLFTKAYANYVNTVPSLTYALTAKNQYNTGSLEDAPSIVEAAKAAGYEIVSISNQVKCGDWDTPVSLILSEADRQYWLNHNMGETTKTNQFDDAVLTPLKEISPSHKMLIIIHIMGNHSSYKERYPKEFDHFEDDRSGHYDNSVLYNDYIMSEIYKTVSAMPHFQALAYFSDHSENIDRELGHDSSNFTYDMTYIPMYIIVSPSYAAAYKETCDALASHRNTCFTNDLIFNTELSLMGIRIDSIYEPENDFASPSYNGDPGRFLTLHGKKRIIDDPRRI